MVAGGVIGERGLELGGHQGRVSGGLEQVVEARKKRVARDVIEGEAAADATAEWGEFGRTQAVGEPGVAGEHDAEELPGIEILAGEHAQLAEDGVERLLGLVDDQDRARERGGDVLGPAGAQRLSAANTKRNPSGTDAVVSGASARATSTSTSPAVAPGNEAAKRSSSDCANAISSGGGGAKRARRTAQVGSPGNVVVHHACQRHTAVKRARMPWRSP